MSWPITNRSHLRIFREKLFRRAKRTPSVYNKFANYKLKIMYAMYQTLDDNQNKEFIRQFGEISTVTTITSALEYCQDCLDKRYE